MIDPAQAEDLRRRGLRLVYATIGWNTFEGAAAIVAGIAAHSVALTAWGLDSSIEVFVGLIAAWQLRSVDDRRERTVLRAIGASFVLVGLYVGVQSTLDLLGGAEPASSPIGIALSSAAVVVMTLLGLWKRSVGTRLGSAVLVADARFSLVDAGLSATVLVGLAAVMTLGWEWADPLVALGIAVLALKEGIEDLRS